MYPCILYILDDCMLQGLLKVTDSLDGDTVLQQREQTSS